MLSIRPFLPSPAEYADLTALWNTLHPEWPRHPSVWERIDAASPPAFRFFADEEDRTVGAIDVRPSDNGSFDFSLFAVPRPGGAALEPLYDAMRAALAPHGSVVLRAYVADNRPWLLDFLSARGFTSVQKTAYSRLDARAFDVEPHVQRAAEVVGQGIQVASLSDLAHGDPEWKKKYWVLTCALLQDVPFEGGFRSPTLEAFAKSLENPDEYNLAASFVALDAGAYVGASRLQTPAEIPQFAFNNLTGTLHSHRRRGLATLLKLAAISYARDAGRPWISTLNDVENPMLILNRALGFEIDHIQHTLRAET